MTVLSPAMTGASRRGARVRIPTLLLYASGAPRLERVVVDTATEALGLGRLAAAAAGRVPPRWRQSRLVRSLLGDGYRTLSYVLDWREAFCEADALDVHACNINDLRAFRAALAAIRRYPLIIVLHSAAGDDLRWLRRGSVALQGRPGRLVVFFGNEYALMSDKLAFVRETGADFIASQLPAAAAEWVYRDRGTARLLLAPAGLNPRLYRPGRERRDIDIGFRGDRYSYAIGDDERTRLIEWFVAHSAASWLAVDIAFERSPREEWSRFLMQCLGTVGAESGTYYLERDGRAYAAAQAYLQRHPDASLEEIQARFFQGGLDAVSGKAISSRHFEPIGTKTCQILIEGGYNGILAAGEHYIAVKRDLSNLHEAIAQFRDDAVRRAIVDGAWEYVLERHTYQHRVRDVLAVVLPTVP